jgi:hypothetical protein
MKDEALASPKDEALKLALEAADGLKDIARQVNELIAENKALKAALAQDETSDSSLSRQAKRSSRAAQEPVVWPFPPATGAIPWTKQQEKAYDKLRLSQQQKQEQLPAAPF